MIAWYSQHLVLQDRHRNNHTSVKCIILTCNNWFFSATWRQHKKTQHEHNIYDDQQLQKSYWSNSSIQILWPRQSDGSVCLFSYIYPLVWNCVCLTFVAEMAIIKFSAHFLHNQSVQVFSPKNEPKIMSSNCFFCPIHSAKHLRFFIYFHKWQTEARDPHVFKAIRFID